MLDKEVPCRQFILTYYDVIIELVNNSQGCVPKEFVEEFVDVLNLLEIKDEGYDYQLEIINE